MKIRQMVTVALGATVLALVTSAGLMSPAAATFTCNQDSGVCTDDSVVDTPLGQVDVSVSESNVVTVHLTPRFTRTFVIGIARALPPGPPTRGFARSSVETTGGTVFIDTIQRGPAHVAIISIHPPSPCRAVTRGDTVVFTPRAG